MGVVLMQKCTRWNLKKKKRKKNLSGICQLLGATKLKFNKINKNLWLLSVSDVFETVQNQVIGLCYDRDFDT